MMTSPMIRDYRCYFFGRDGKFKDFIEFARPDDDAAIAAAQQVFERLGYYAGFELWEGSRKVYLGTRPADRK